MRPDVHLQNFFFYFFFYFFLLSVLFAASVFDYTFHISGCYCRRSNANCTSFSHSRIFGTSYHY
jgi:hypothetical protein